MTQWSTTLFLINFRTFAEVITWMEIFDELIKLDFRRCMHWCSDQPVSEKHFLQKKRDKKKFFNKKKKWDDAFRPNRCLKAQMGELPFYEACLYLSSFPIKWLWLKMFQFFPIFCFVLVKWKSTYQFFLNFKSLEYFNVFHVRLFIKKLLIYCFKISNAAPLGWDLETTQVQYEYKFVLQTDRGQIYQIDIL